jgi:hypothetical protein
MRESKQIDWKTVLTGIVAYEQPFAALDGERFERIERGFSSHYDVQRVSSDAFAFTRGEGYSRLPRWDAFGYVDRGRVERVRNAETELPDVATNVAVLPAGWKAIRFTLDIRVVLIFWAALLLGLRFFVLPDTPIPAWLTGFGVIWALHGWLVMRSLDGKLHNWMARPSWN